MQASFVLALGALLGFSAAAAAQDPVQQSTAECLCVLPTDGGVGVAAVQDVEGEVLLSGIDGYTPIQSGAGLSVGDRLVLLNDGRAVLTGPACRVALSPNSMISLIPSEAGLCVAQATTGPATVSAGAGQLPASQIAELLVFGGLVPAGIVGIVSAARDDAGPVSP